jgi:hypothetical protein
MIDETITHHRAKQIIRGKLDELGVPFTKLTAKWVNFSDLARVRCMFVKIHGWKPNPAWSELRLLAVVKGFRLETDWE